MAKPDTKLKVSFGVELPVQERTSRYEALYELLTENSGVLGDVTDAITQICESVGSKTPNPTSAAATLRKKGFYATARLVDGQMRVFAGHNVELADDDE